MNGIWRLSLLRLSRHPLQTMILVLCIAVTIFLPWGVRSLIADYQSGLVARAQATPMILGTRSNRFDLTFAALYFRQANLETIPYPETQRLQDQGEGLAVPIHARFTAQGYSVVGTSLEYFEMRGCRLQEGTLPLILGDVVLGANVADQLSLSVGDDLFSDQRELYDIAVAPALKMKVVGVLAATQAADDGAVFVGVETSWILEGLAHGHMDPESSELNPNLILGQDESNVVLSQAMLEYNQITPANLESFHYHGNPEHLPLSAILFWPKDLKSGTLSKARVNQKNELRMIEPTAVMDDLLAFVLRVRQLLDGVSGLLAVITVLLTLLVFTLSSQLRRREMRTLERLGCSRFFVRSLYLSEFAIVLSMAMVLATCGVYGVRRLLSDLLLSFV